MDLDDIFMRSYLNEYSERENKKIFLSQEDRAIAAQKKVKLEIIEKFLQKFVDLEIKVNHCDQYTKNTKSMDGVEPQLFSFQLIDSSPSWAPGISILFNHPAEVEIAIPNNIQNQGVVVIKVASHHPDAYIIEKKFTSYESACEALGRFLGKCTTSMGKNPKKILQTNSVPLDIEKKQQNTSFIKNVPEAAPNKNSNETLTSLKQINNLFVNKDNDSENN